MACFDHPVAHTKKIATGPRHLPLLTPLKKKLQHCCTSCTNNKLAPGQSITGALVSPNKSTSYMSTSKEVLTWYWSCHCQVVLTFGCHTAPETPAMHLAATAINGTKLPPHRIAMPSPKPTHQAHNTPAKRASRHWSGSCVYATHHSKLSKQAKTELYKSISVLLSVYLWTLGKSESFFAHDTHISNCPHIRRFT